MAGQPTGRVARTHRYQRLGALASGGMGTVYLGRMTADGATRTVAMKVMHPHLAADEDMVAMFLDEARVATRLRHPNLVGVLDVDMLGDEIVIVMEYVEGITLGAMQSALRQRGKQLPIGFAVRILSDALAGLHELHEVLDDKGQPLGLVHRDVSPHNLLIGSDGVTRVTDFGVALAAGRLATTRPDGTVKGKLQYLAPEQVGRKRLDRRVDVFAAGIVLWECLTFCETGRRLFEGSTEAETVARVLRDPIAPASSIRPEIALEVDEVCLKALERDPERRFETAAAFAEALRRAFGPLPAGGEVGALAFELASEPILKQRQSLGRASSALSRPLGDERRRPLLVAVVGVVVCVLAAGAAMLLGAPPRPHAPWGAEPLGPSSPRRTTVNVSSSTPGPASATSAAAGAPLPDPPPPPKERAAVAPGPARRAPPAKSSKPRVPFMPDDL